jgi:DNA adenine methylase
MQTLQPFLKWAGGKRWFIRRHEECLPTSFNRYIEPFLGSGAVFFNLSPKRAILSDTNLALINTYRAIRDDWRLVWRYLCQHQQLHSKKYYYECRSKEFRSPHTRAAQFIYLNRACWNGLYRVNLRGEFNVPIGTKDTIIFPDDDFAAIAGALKSASLRAVDFEKIINIAKEGDLLFVDPPYTINHNANGFLKYNEQIFSWHDQTRLRNALKKAAARGAKIVSTNADHQSIRELYAETGTITVLPRHSVLAGNATFRKPSTELLIKMGF